MAKSLGSQLRDLYRKEGESKGNDNYNFTNKKDNEDKCIIKNKNSYIHYLKENACKYLVKEDNDRLVLGFPILDLGPYGIFDIIEEAIKMSKDDKKLRDEDIPLYIASNVAHSLIFYTRGIRDKYSREIKVDDQIQTKYNFNLEALLKVFVESSLRVLAAMSAVKSLMDYYESKGIKANKKEVYENFSLGILRYFVEPLKIFENLNKDRLHEDKYQDLLVKYFMISHLSKILTSNIVESDNPNEEIEKLSSLYKRIGKEVKDENLIKEIIDYIYKDPQSYVRFLGRMYNKDGKEILNISFDDAKELEKMYGEKLSKYPNIQNYITLFKELEKRLSYNNNKLSKLRSSFESLFKKSYKKS